MPETKQTYTFHTQVITDPATITEITQSDDSGLLNNQALHLFNQGDLADATNIHLQALRIKERLDGLDSISTSISKNALGELYFNLRQPNEAEENFKQAIAIRNAAGPQYSFDAAVSRENLAKVYKMRGDTKSAKEIRTSAGKANMVCANHTVHHSKIVPSVMVDYYFSAPNNNYTKHNWQNVASAR